MTLTDLVKKCPLFGIKNCYATKIQNFGIQTFKVFEIFKYQITTKTW